MSIFKNLFGNKSKEKNKVVVRATIEDKENEEELNNLEIDNDMKLNELEQKNLEIDKVIKDMENEMMLKELENQKKLEANRRLLNYKISNKLQEVYPYFYQYFSNLPLTLDLLLDFSNKIDSNINNNTLTNIFYKILWDAEDCNTFEDLDKRFSKDYLSALYQTYYKKIYCENETVRSRIKYINYSINEMAQRDGNLFAQYSALIDLETIMLVLQKYEVNTLMDKIKKIVNNNSEDLINKYYDILDYDSEVLRSILNLILGLVKILYLSNYINKINENEEFALVIENYLSKNINIGVHNELYEIYKEFYNDAFEILLNSNDFSLMITMFELYNNNRLWIENMQSIFDLLEIDCEKIINDYLALNNTNISIYEYSSELIVSKIFDTLIIYPRFNTLASQYSQFIMYKLIGKIDIENWFSMLFSKNTFVEKVAIYHKKYELLNMDRTKVELIMQLQELLSNVTSGEEFELFLKYLYELMGYMVELTPKTGDQGADLVLRKSNEKVVVQAKFYNNPVGNAAVQEVVAAIKYYKADNAIVVTNSTFTKSAIELAESNNIKLVDGDALNGCVKMLL